MSEPIIVDNPTWHVIASGQQTLASHAHRWEAVNINGWAVFNNGRDLPRTYRIGDTTTYPIYELRELGVAHVGCIAEHAGILLAGNIGEIREDKLDDLFRLNGIIDSGSISATQAGTTVTASADIFTATMVGCTIVYNDEHHTQVKITVYTSAKVVTVGTAVTISDATAFEIRIKAYQTGADHSGLTTGVMASGSAIVTASANIFNPVHVNQYVWFLDGFHKKIITYTDQQHVVLETAPTFAITAQPFFIVDITQDYKVTADSAIFTADMVGKKILWEDGSVRTIVEYLSSTVVNVDMYVPVLSDLIGVENTDTYAVYTQDQYVNKIGYKVAWSMPGLPRRWGPNQLGSITKASRNLQLKFPMKSLENDHQIVITGAGVSGGNHTTTILRMYGLNTHFTVTTAANETVHEQPVMRADSIGSICGAFDLQDDGSPILRIKDCRGELVVYKETSIFIGKYSGLVDEPFAFKKLNIPNGTTLYYPWTLIEVVGMWHFYAGRNRFYRFDMTNQIPEIVVDMEICSDLFFKAISPSDREKIFASDNHLTGEIFIQFPTTHPDKGICYDYVHNTVSTTSISVTAAGMIKRPWSNLSEDWFIMGNTEGTVLLYGKQDNPWGPWGGRRDIFFRRGTNPFNSSLIDYDSVLRSGLSELGAVYDEKDWVSFVLFLASQEIGQSSPTITIKFYGARNPSEQPTLLGTKVIPQPLLENLIDIFFTNHCFQDYILASGNAPCRISKRLWDVAGIKSKSFIRRITS